MQDSHGNSTHESTVFLRPSQDTELLESLKRQCERWDQGEPVGIEELLAGIPNSERRTEAILELVSNEVVLRKRLGQHPSLEEYTRRFPEIAEALSIQWKLDRILVDDSIAHSPPDQPRRIGRYEVRSELGRGAIGVVFEAYDTHLRRAVAIKRLRAGVDAPPAEIARLRSEAEALARLHHPNIVQVHDVGESQGQPFLAMEYCPAGSLASRLNGEPLPPHIAANLTRQIAEGIAAVHDHGIVHRDIKPANVLLQVPRSRDKSTDTNLSEMTLKVTDFGLAKFLDADHGYTHTGALLGTPAYMAPEQSDSTLGTVGPLTDIYSIGVILYELLTGRSPFRGATTAETLEIARRREPVSPRQLQPRLPRDLETIVLKCLQKKPGHRYAGVRELSADLARFLDGHPIKARPASPVERAWRWCRRNPVLAALEAAFAVAVLAALTILLVSNELIRREASAKSKALSEKVRALHDRELALGEKESALLQAKRSERLAQQRFFASEMNRAGHAVSDNEWNRALSLLEGQRPGPHDEDFRGFEWHYLERCIHRHMHRSFRQSPGEVWQLAFSPDGTTLAAASGEPSGTSGAIRLWDVQTVRLRATLFEGEAVPHGLDYSPDGNAIAGGLTNTSVVIWDAHTHREVRRFQTGRVIRSLDWSPTGKILAVGCQNGEIHAWRLADGQSLHEQLKTMGGPVLTTLFSRDGSRLMTSTEWGSDGRLTRVHVVEDDTLRWERDVHGISMADVGTENSNEIVGLNWARVSYINLTDGVESFAHVVSPGCLGTVRVSPDGQRYASAGRDDRMAILWDRKLKQPVAQGAHLGAVMAVAFDEQGRYWATGSSDGQVKIWHYNAPPEFTHWLHETFRGNMFVTPDGTLITSGESGSAARNLESGEAVDFPSVAGLRCVSQDGQTLVSVSSQTGGRPLIQVWDRASGSVRCSVELSEEETIAGQALAVSRSGRFLAMRTWSSPVVLWDVSGSNANQVRQFKPGDCMHLEFSPDEKSLVAACQFGRVREWKLEDESPAFEWMNYESSLVWCNRIAFSSDGTRLAAGNDLGIVRVWDVPQRKLLATLAGHQGQTRALLFMPDHRTIAVAGVGPIQLWNTEIGEECLAIRVPDYKVPGLAISADGKILVSQGDNGDIRIWRSSFE